VLDVLPEADVVIIAAALTPETHHLIGDRALEAMREDAVLVNIARGGLVDTAALVAALHRGAIGGAGLDVVDPEPLSDGHPLWREPRCLITPHTANTPNLMAPLFAARITANVEAFLSGHPLAGVVDTALGY
jgi:phosphoglycerate dehydrogenase-like enzyme